jgi:DNA repair protein RadC
MSCLEGHRQRLRDRFNTSELGAFEGHEALELLQTYAVPRKDLKPIGHALLEHLGSLANVLDARTAAELVQVDGVGETGARLLHLVPGLTRRDLRGRWGSKPKTNTREEFDALSVPFVDQFVVAAPLTFGMAEARLLRVAAGAST